MLINKKIILVILVVVLAIPICLQLFVFNNDIVSNVSNDGWAGFFGGYIGSIIGALTTLVVVFIQRRDVERDRKRDEILSIRPYLHFHVTGWGTNGEETKITGEIRNIGLHSACDIWLYENDMDHPNSNESLVQHLSICAGEGEKIELAFDFEKTVYYLFSFYDLKSNRYEQEVRFDSESKKFYSLEPYITKYSEKVS